MVDGIESHLYLSNILKEDEMVQCKKEQGLAVAGLKKQVSIPLLKAYTRKTIAYKPSQIPKSELTLQGDHRKCVAEEVMPYRGDLEVNLLIGRLSSHVKWSLVHMMIHIVLKQSNAVSGGSQVSGHPGQRKTPKEWRGHYEMQFPLRFEDIDLPNNRSKSQRRFSLLKARFKRGSNYRKDYAEFIEDMIAHCAEKALLNNKNTKIGNGRINYVPHYRVYHQTKPSPIRVLFDCSAAYKGTSDMTNSLTGVLCRFLTRNCCLNLWYERNV